MTSPALTTMLYHPIDIEIRGTSPLDNPFFAEVQATFAGPNREQLVIPGFYTGDNRWVVRFSPTATGEWAYACSSPHVAIETGEGGVTCQPNTNPAVHGGLRVDPAHPHHFRYEDGTPYFFMGYEADWLWAPGLGDPEIRKVKELIDQIKAHKFNQVFVNVYAHDTRWCEGKTSEFDYGPPAMYAWEGDNDNPDHSRLNPAFFENFDRMMDYLLQNGIVAHLYLRVYNKAVNWPANASPEDDLYFRYVTARYQAYPNVVWDFSKETFNERDKDYVANRLRLIRAQDAYGRLTTVHDCPDFAHNPRYAHLLDFFTDQHQPADWYSRALYERARRPIPYVNAEFGYERKDPQVIMHAVASQLADELMHRACEVIMGGGYITYYYNPTAWDVVDSRHVPDGYRYCRILHDFFAGLQWWKLEPLLYHGWRSGVRCLADAGREYVFYFPKGKLRQVSLGGTEGVFSERWVHLFSGESKQMPDRTLGIPASRVERVQLKGPFDEGPCLVHLKRKD
ncbi:MAG: DUF4038 domain-containing protein [Kiritimatiellae bacterium]|nr:DUF4038 domain-containing protein [Kiritimatiellia bacterium]